MSCCGKAKVDVPVPASGTMLDALPEAPKVEVPKFDLPGDADDAEEIYAHFQTLVGKLQVAKEQVYAALEPSTPEVKIELPRLHPSMLERRCRVTTGADERSALIAVEEGTAGAMSATEEGQEQAREAASELATAVKAAAGAALAALTVAVGIACLPLGVFGPLVSGAAAAILNWAAMRRMWRGRCAGFFGVVEAKHRSVFDKVHEALDHARQQVASVVERVEGILDRLIDEQRPTIAQLAKHEDELKMAKPDFEAPDHEDLKRPLEAAQDLLDGFLRDAKAEVPAKLQEHAASSVLGRLSTERPFFERWAVSVPLYAILLVNLATAVAQWAALSLGELSATGVGEATASATAPGNSSDFSLRGAAVPAPPMGVDTDVQHWKAVLLPAIVQVVLALAQQVIAVALLAAPRICDAVNGIIASGEERVNKEANSKIEAAVRKLVDGALSGVRVAADGFFPKFEECVQQLEPVLETSARAAALAKGRAF